MDVAYMRNYISDAYSGANWKAKVMVMPDKQVMAIFYSLKEREKAKKADKKAKKLFSSPSAEYKAEQEQGRQITLFDLMSEDDLAKLREGRFINEL